MDYWFSVRLSDYTDGPVQATRTTLMVQCNSTRPTSSSVRWSQTNSLTISAPKTQREAASSRVCSPLQRIQSRTPRSNVSDASSMCGEISKMLLRYVSGYSCYTASIYCNLSIVQVESEDNQEKPEIFIDPFEYWHSKRLQFPRLAQMAIDILSVPCMSAKCERLFSAAGLMVSDLRSRLHASTIGLAQTVRSWYRQGIINAEVPLVIIGKDQQESVIQYTEDRLPSRQQKDDSIDGVRGDMYSSE